MPAMPPASGVAGGDGRGEARRLCRLGVLGTAAAGVWGSLCPGPDRGLGAGRARRQSDRAHFHGRPVGGLAVRGAVAGGLCEPGFVRLTGRWAGAARLLDQRRGALRAAGESADAGRARQLPAISGPRAGAAGTCEGDRVPGRVCVGRGPAGSSRRRVRGRSSPTAQKRRSTASRCWAATTPRNRTPSRAA